MKPLPLLLACGVLLAALQQQLLLRRPPRLLDLVSSSASSGPAALSLRFSRPMNRASLAALSSLNPTAPHQWLGSGDALRLLLTSQQPIHSAMALVIRGRDQRGLTLPPQRWRWDPRPRLLAVVPTDQGEQLQLQQRDGRWQPLTPVLEQITAVQPLGNGTGMPSPPGKPRANACGCCRSNKAPCSLRRRRNPKLFKPGACRPCCRSR